ncbi:MAG: ATP phosphoribosyltransferase regulatory subunit [Magnetococcales bacterium]|nr:ATP phosphoribosyltransferase regulatory subunit [Magnetococcales bacterium]
MTTSLCPSCRDHFDDVTGYAHAMALPFRVNPLIVRGLDYYNRTVFEVTTTALGAQNAVAAGGRYDDLVSAMGGTATPAIGFAAGLERLVLLLEQHPSLPKRSDIIYIAYTGQNGLKEGLILAEEMRTHGWHVELHGQEASLKSQLKKADRMGATVTLILGDQEIDTGTVLLKNMGSGQQETVPRASLPDHMQRIRNIP